MTITKRYIFFFFLNCGDIGVFFSNFVDMFTCTYIAMRVDMNMFLHKGVYYVPKIFLSTNGYF
jgi:hypothetical protein